MEIGGLYQYKQSCYGRYYASLPKVPFEPLYFQHSSTHANVFKDWKLPYVTPRSTQETARKKFVLIAAEIVTVVHPKLPKVSCDYIKCFISDPYKENETRYGWVRAEWIEVLDENDTYWEEDQKQYLEKVSRANARLKEIRAKILKR